MCTQHSFVATLFYIELVCRLFSFLMCPFGSVYVCVSHNLPSKPFYLWHRFNTGHGVAPRRSNCSSLWWIAENSIKTYRTTGITSAILSLLPIYWYQFYRAHGNTLTSRSAKITGKFCALTLFFFLLGFFLFSILFLLDVHERSERKWRNIEKRKREYMRMKTIIRRATVKRRKLRILNYLWDMRHSFYQAQIQTGCM